MSRLAGGKLAGLTSIEAAHKKNVRDYQCQLAAARSALLDAQKRVRRARTAQLSIPLGSQRSRPKQPPSVPAVQADDSRGEAKRLRRVCEAQTRELKFCRNALEGKIEQIEAQTSELDLARQHLQLTRVDSSRERVSRAVELSMVSRSQHQQIAEKLEVQNLGMCEKIRRLQQQLEEREAAMLRQQAEIRRHQQEANLLVEAVEWRGTQLGIAPGYRSEGDDDDHPAMLLLEVAKLRKEKQALAIELGQRHVEIRQLRDAALDVGEAHELQMGRARADREAVLEADRARVKQLEAELGAIRLECSSQQEHLQLLRRQQADTGAEGRKLAELLQQKIENQQAQIKQLLESKGQLIKIANQRGVAAADMGAGPPAPRRQSPARAWSQDRRGVCVPEYARDTISSSQSAQDHRADRPSGSVLRGTGDTIPQSEHQRVLSQLSQANQHCEQLARSKASLQKTLIEQGASSVAAEWQQLATSFGAKSPLRSPALPAARSPRRSPDRGSSRHQQQHGGAWHSKATAARVSTGAQPLGTVPRAGGGGGSAATPAELLFGMLDKNGDGSISLEEMNAALGGGGT